MLLLRGLFVLGVAALVSCVPVIFHGQELSTQTPEFQAHEIVEKSELPVQSGLPLNQIHACIWAALTCCEPDSAEANSKCFKSLGCNHEVWNMCSFESGRAYIRAAEKYFGVQDENHRV